MSHHRWLTPAGQAAVAIVRVHGDLSRLTLRSPRGKPVAFPAAGCVRLVWLWDDGRAVDEALAIGLGADSGGEPGRRGAAGELHVHGGPGVVQGVADWLEQRGFRRAEHAPPIAAARSLREARARLSARYGPLARLVAEARAGVGPAAPGLRARALAALELETFARRLAVPAVVRLAGRPNAGKSTLFNALLGAERALVSPRAGTTRDTVAATWMLRGVPVRLEDTAGRVRDAAEVLAGADLVVHLTSEDSEAPIRGDGGVRGGAPAVVVRGKADRLGRAAAARSRDERRAEPGLAVSGLTGAGLPQLVELLAEVLGIPADPRCDVLAPVDADQLAVLRELVDRAAV